MIIGIITFDGKLFILGIGLVFIGDFSCAIGSANYMSHPTNGYEFKNNICSEYNFTSGSYDSHPCIMPTQQDNPYEKQPLHPIAWISGFVWDLCKTTGGAIHFKVA